MKILIIRFSSLGDIVLTTPIIRAVKTHLSEAEVHFVTKSAYKDVLIENPYLSKIYTLEASLWELAQTLRSENYDYIIDLHHNLRTFILKQLLRKKSYSYPKENINKWLLTALKVNRMPSEHVVDRYFRAVAPLGVKNDSLGLDHFIPEKDEVDLDWLPEGFQRYAAVVIGGKKATKRLPTSRLIELCDRINKPVILLGGKEDVERGREIEKFFSREGTDSSFEEGLRALGKTTTVFNACGKFNIHQSASVLKQAQWIFTHDTGLMHIAAAFKKELFTIWGSTVPEFGMYPYRTKFTIFEKKNLSCRPCSKIGFDKCPKGHFKCMNEVTFDFYLPD
ncbi:glycosyltransferase family 9 protein [Marinoscillum furvescens]|uniref:ADP-heptose:LPS heptosyltransferase n=1 Tax=Marinoscillum furvescens DSM 4134 TaxID=1122208 RepID=A0A3D9LGK5_MARFU|nr:glycosyltransferase family 9 protein [Marinoscillum furvescens]REE05820.1 ADP-heptose:LPS heptosyltransferase [Marinoscillum furvescens DSM 4134]